MDLVLLVTDETAKGEHLNTVKLKLESDRLTLRALIEKRVKSEVEQFNLRRPVCFKSLVKPRDAEETQTGYRLKSHRDLDWQVQSKEAVAAFQDKCFFIYVNGRDMRDLEEEFVVDHKTQVAFVKLMPVIAG